MATNVYVSSWKEEDTPLFDVKTVKDGWKRGYDLGEEKEKKTCLGWRGKNVLTGDNYGAYEWMDYKQVQQRLEHIGSGLRKIKALPQQCLGIYSKNTPEWMLVDLACAHYGYINVPIYDTLGMNALECILEETSMEVIFIEKIKIALMMKGIDKRILKQLKWLIVLDRVDEGEELPTFLDSGISCQIMGLKALEEIGRAKYIKSNVIHEEDLYTICYTSGTLGKPKGVMLTHGNMVANVKNLYVLLHTNLSATGIEESKETYLSFLPLAHIFERFVMLGILFSGCRVGFFGGDLLRVGEDMQTLKPTILLAVPRLLNRVYNRIQTQLKKQSLLKRTMFEVAINAKKACIRRGQYQHWLWDRLVFNTIKERTGGNLKVFFCGSAPLSCEVAEFLSAALSCPILEGYGLTEAGGLVTLQQYNDPVRNQIGKPVPFVELKLVDVLEMDYTSEDQPYARGELCVRGPSIMKGYYKSNETKHTIDKDGWLHTGDIAMVDEEERFYIIDRKKNIFKLSQGEYVSPEKIEAIYSESSFISQCFVYGDSYQSSLIGIVVPEGTPIMDFATEQGLEGDFSSVIKTDAVKNLIILDMERLAKQADLKGFEKVHIIHLEAQPFTVEQGLLTPTQKLRRHQAKIHFADIITQLYATYSQGFS